MTRTMLAGAAILILTSAVVAGARASRFELGSADRTSLQESLPASRPAGQRAPGCLAA